MKVLHVFPETGMGGTEKVILQISRFLMEKEGAVIGMCASGGVRKEEFQDAGIHLFDVPKFKEKQCFFSNLKYLKKYFGFFKPDVVHTHSLYSLLLVFLLKKISSNKYAIVHTGHGGPRKNYNKYAMLMAWMADRYIALSYDIFIDLKKRTCSSSIVCIPNGVNLPPQEEVYNNKDYSPNQILNLGFIGRLTEQKGLPILISAVEKLNKNEIYTTLDIIGDGELRPEFEKSVKEKGLNDKISFWGYQNNPWKLLKSKAVVVMPSLWEASPLVAFEAIVRNHTLVTSDLIVFQDVLRNGYDGYFFRKGDINDLVTVLSQVFRGELSVKFITTDQQKRFIFDYSTGPKIRDLYLELISQ